LASVATAWPFAAQGQQANKVFRIGYVGLHDAGSLPERLEAFRAGMRSLGYEEGRNVVIEYRWAEGHYERLPAIFAEMVRLKVDVIVTHGTPGVLAAKKATTTIPIVFATSGDALASGLVDSLARPGGNVTGLTFFNPELAAKRLEPFREIVTGLTDVGVLSNPANPFEEAIMPSMTLTAQRLKLTLHEFGARGPPEFEAAFAAMAKRSVGALVVLDDPTLIANAPALANLALQQRLPSSGWPDFARAGGLFSYGVDFPDLFRRAATFVDKILKGAKPGDLPVELPNKIELVINLKTAKALGLTIPQSLLLRADEVIQ
jgi:putative ABC transport system substrate-binding protein